MPEFRDGLDMIDDDPNRIAGDISHSRFRAAALARPALLFQDLHAQRAPFPRFVEFFLRRDRWRSFLSGMESYRGFETSRCIPHPFDFRAFWCLCGRLPNFKHQRRFRNINADRLIELLAINGGDHFIAFLSRPSDHMTVNSHDGVRKRLAFLSALSCDEADCRPECIFVLEEPFMQAKATSSHLDQRNGLLHVTLWESITHKPCRFPSLTHACALSSALAFFAASNPTRRSSAVTFPFVAWTIRLIVSGGGNLSPLTYLLTVACVAPIRSANAACDIFGDLLLRKSSRVIPATIPKWHRIASDFSYHFG